MKRVPLLLYLLAASVPAFGDSPFAAGATSLVAETLAFLQPVLLIATMVVGVLAAIGKPVIGTLIGLLIGTAFVFGAQQIQVWISALFGF